MGIRRQSRQAERRFRVLIFVEGWTVREIDRLINAGMDANTAFDTVYCFMKQDNAAGLERYVSRFEHEQRNG